MRTRIVFFWLLLMVYAAPCLAANDYPPRPEPPRYVNDFAGVLSGSENEALDTKLRNYNDSTSTGIVIVIIHSIGNNDLEEYATGIGEKWGVGKKGKANGVLILAAIDDRKLFIATGRGSEAKLTDIMTRRVREEYMNPNFKAGQYYKGFDEGTTAIIKILAGEFKGGGKPTNADPLTPRNILILLFFGVIVLIFFSRIFGGGHSGYSSSGPYMGGGWLGGGFGGGGGGGGSNDSGGFGGGSFGGGGSGGSW